jgi:hypothetical protein
VNNRYSTGLSDKVETTGTKILTSVHVSSNQGVQTLQYNIYRKSDEFQTSTIRAQNERQPHGDDSTLRKTKKIIKGNMKMYLVLIYSDSTCNKGRMKLSPDSKYILPELKLLLVSI